MSSQKTKLSSEDTKQRVPEILKQVTKETSTKASQIFVIYYKEL